MGLESGISVDNILNSSELPIISDGKVGKIKHDTNRLFIIFNKIENKYPDSLININIKYPSFSENIKGIKGILANILVQKNDVSNVNYLEQYNFYAYGINNTLNKMKINNQESTEELMTDAIYGELEFDEFDESMFTKEQQKELKGFSKKLWIEFFPESNIDKFVKGKTNQEELDDYQKILLAPANGIENIIIGISDLFNLDSYKETYESIGTLTDLSYADWCDLWKGLKFTYEQLGTTDKITPIVSFIFSIGFLIGGIGKITELATKLKLPNELINIIKVSSIGINSKLSINSSGKAALIGAMTGITLPYLK